jgi:hypothetical protein
MPTDALRHFFVAGLSGGEINAAAGICNKMFGISALTRTGAAEDESDGG